MSIFGLARVEVCVSPYSPRCRHRGKTWQAGWPWGLSRTVKSGIKRFSSTHLLTVQSEQLDRQLNQFYSPPSGHTVRPWAEQPGRVPTELRLFNPLNLVEKKKRERVGGG